MEQFDSSDVPAASQPLALTTVCPFSGQESSQYRQATTSLGWTVAMCTEPPATLDCKKSSNSRLAASRRCVDGLSATAFVNWANCCSMADLSMHSKVVSLLFEPYVLYVAHHCQKWNVPSCLPWCFEHRILPRVPNTRIGVLGGVLAAGIPRTRAENTTSRTGRMERTSPSRFRSACRTCQMRGEAKD